MIRPRSILASFLALLMTFLVACGSPNVAAIPTYTDAQIAQIQKYSAEISAFRERLTELDTLIQKRDWVFTSNLIHGPLGTLRETMGFFTRNLLPKDQPKAQQVAKEVATDLESINKAAQSQNYDQAITSYAETLKDLDAFLDLAPKS